MASFSFKVPKGSSHEDVQRAQRALGIPSSEVISIDGVSKNMAEQAELDAVKAPSPESFKNQKVESVIRNILYKASGGKLQPD